MRILIGILFSSAATITAAGPAAARDCYWRNGEIWCHPACRVTNRWIAGSREWMEWSCGLTPDELLLVGGLVLVVVIAIIGSIASSATTNAHQADIAQIERDMATDEELRHDMQDAMRKADAHIASMLEKYRKGE